MARYLAASKKPGGMPAPYWQVFWLDAWGKRQRRNFRVGIHGERKAKRLAREAYAQGLAEAHAVLQRNALLEQQTPRLGKEHEPLLPAAAFAAESLRPRNFSQPGCRPRSGAACGRRARRRLPSG